MEGARILRAIASRAPSLGIVCTMHNFSASTLVEWAVFGEEYGEFLLSGLAENSMYLASGFAEGRSGCQAPRDDHAGPAGARRRMAAEGPEAALHPDLLHGLPDLRRERGDRGRGRRRAVGLVPADSPGIRRRPFWKSHVLAGAESDEVILEDVHVPDDFVFVVEGSDALDPVEVTGYIWLQLALSSTYLGIVSGLVERLLESGKGTPEERGGAVARVEAQAAAVDGIAYAFGAERTGITCWPAPWRCGSPSRGPSSPSPCGAPSSSAAWRSSAAPTWPISCAPRALAFHPPGRLPASRALDEYARGGVLDVS